ncbi:MAG: metallophosphoesterase family protein [Alphaproteobacteria bacterium]|nr:metallophosphoesterase family protein [Alphaproteobacteria bacterium]MCB9930143.1 metallophosphoesterase family protein [Alphaproteobacteria bacterium]
MKIGIVSDIHGNMAGLQKAVDLMGAVDELLCLGDSIYDYRFSNEVIGWLREHEIPTILGNHEWGFLGPQGERARAAAWVDQDLVAWLEAQPYRMELERCGQRILMVHSTPWEPYGDYVLPGSRDLRRFGEAGADIVLYGHTHQQVAERFGDVLVVNPGSAGDARDTRNGRQLSCAVLDLAAGDVRIIDYTV